MAGPIQNEVNSLLTTTAVIAGGFKHLKQQKSNTEAVKKLNDNLGRNQAAGTDFNQLNSAMAFQKANQGQLEGLIKERGNLLRSKPMLEKTGKWTDVQLNRLANIEEKIKMYSNANTEVENFLEDKLTGLGRGTSTTFEEGKK